MLTFATIGSAAVYLLFVWLLSAAGAAWLAERKGYTERVGLMFGLVLSLVGFVIVLLLPGRPGSTWKIEGPLPNPGARRPLGMPALGPAAGAADATGPALSDAPERPLTGEPGAGAGAAAHERLTTEPGAGAQERPTTEPGAGAQERLTTEPGVGAQERLTGPPGAGGREPPADSPGAPGPERD